MFLKLFPDKNDAQYQHLAGQMKHARRKLRRHLEEILNSFIYGYSNGPVEGANNRIKARTFEFGGFCFVVHRVEDVLE